MCILWFIESSLPHIVDNLMLFTWNRCMKFIHSFTHIKTLDSVAIRKFPLERFVFGCVPSQQTDRSVESDTSYINTYCEKKGVFNVGWSGWGWWISKLLGFTATLQGTKGTVVSAHTAGSSNPRADVITEILKSRRIPDRP